MPTKSTFTFAQYQEIKRLHDALMDAEFMMIQSWSPVYTDQERDDARKARSKARDEWSEYLIRQLSPADLDKLAAAPVPAAAHVNHKTAW